MDIKSYNDAEMDYLLHFIKFWGDYSETVFGDAQEYKAKNSFYLKEPSSYNYINVHFPDGTSSLISEANLAVHGILDMNPQQWMVSAMSDIYIEVTDTTMPEWSMGRAQLKEFSPKGLHTMIANFAKETDR